MPNNFITARQVAMEALERLDGTAVLTNNVYRDYENEFRNTGDTVTIRVPAVMEQATEFDTEVVAEDLKETSISLTLDHHYDKTVAVTSRERTLSIVNFADQVVTPMMESMVNRVESDMAGLARFTPYMVKGSGTDGAVKLEDLTRCRTILSGNHFPLSNRLAVLTPEGSEDILNGPTFNNAQSAGDSGAALREGQIGRVRGFDAWETVYPYYHTNGTGAAVKATGAAGATSISVTGTSGTIKKGDILTITGAAGTYVALADVAALSASAEALPIYPALQAAVNAADVAITGEGSTSLVYHKNAILLATRPLALPMNASPEDAAVETYKGLSVRVVFFYDGNKKKDMVSIDMLAGMCLARPSGVVRLVR